MSNLPERRQGGSLVTHAGVTVAVILVAAITFWFLAGVAYRIFHLVELLVVAGAAGALGYRIGHRGRRRS